MAFRHKRTTSMRVMLRSSVRSMYYATTCSALDTGKQNKQFCIITQQATDSDVLRSPNSPCARRLKAARPLAARQAACDMTAHR
eukprot:6175374-Pleurochrysis_carterae.AAC.1